MEVKVPALVFKSPREAEIGDGKFLVHSLTLGGDNVDFFVRDQNLFASLDGKLDAGEAVRVVATVDLYGRADRLKGRLRSVEPAK